MNQTPSPEQLQALLNFASKKLNMSPEKLAATVQSGGLSGLSSSLSPQNAAKLNALVGDKAKAEQLLGSPEVRRMLDNIMKRKP